MIFVQTDENLRVIYTNYFPLDSKLGLGLTEEELLSKGYLVESIPAPQNIEGKTHTLFFDGIEFTYEYQDEILSPEQEILKLKNQQTLMQQALDDLILGGTL